MGIFDTLLTRREPAPPPPGPRNAEAKELAGSGMSLYLSGVMKDRPEQKDEALELADKALGIDPGCAEAHALRGLILAGRKGDAEAQNEALLCFERALRIDPSDYSSWYNRGQVLFDLGRYTEALTSIERALDSKEASRIREAILITKGKVLGELGKYAEAASIFENIPPSASRYGDAAGGRARILELQGKCGEAARWYAGAAYYHQKNGSTVLAIQCIDESLRLNPADHAVQFTRGTLLLVLHSSTRNPAMLEKALDCFNRLIREYPENVNYLAAAAASLSLMRRFPESLELVDRALRRNPQDDQLLMNKAHILVELKRHDEAIACLTEVARLKPDLAGPRYQLALILHGLGRNGEALDEINHAIRLGGKQADLLRIRAGILRDLGRNDEAAKDEAESRSHAHAPRPRNGA